LTLIARKGDHLKHCGEICATFQYDFYSFEPDFMSESIFTNTVIRITGNNNSEYMSCDYCNTWYPIRLNYFELYRFDPLELGEDL